MKKILAMLCICFISVLCLCSCNKQEVNNTQITYIEAEPEFPELKNI